jgi:hypothetical protein
VVGGDEGEWEVEVQGRVKWVVVSLTSSTLAEYGCFGFFLE